LGLAVLNLEAYIKGQPLSKFLIITVISASILTQSASGLVGCAVFLVLFSAKSLIHIMNIRRLFLSLTILTLTSILMYGFIISSEHILAYLKSTSDLWYLLESGSALPHLMMIQSSNIYPLYDLTVKARELNILPVIIGSGMGSSSAITNYYTSIANASIAIELSNPNSQLVRSLFESGIVGTYFFIMSFFYPVKQFTKRFKTKDRRRFIILILLLIGCFMGHRSSAPFIYLGIAFAVFRPMQTTFVMSGIMPNTSVGVKKK
jgi:hypothetical protein